MSGPELLRIATVGAAHGLRGEVRLALHTDDPAGRLAAGSRFVTDPPDAGPLEIEVVREAPNGATYVRFVGAEDRTAVEALRGLVLLGDPVDEDDAWYPADLVGLRAERRDGTVVGEVVAVEHPPAHDVLVVREPDGARTLVPFVTAIVPTVDVSGGRVVLDPPVGLLAADQPAEPDAHGHDDGPPSA